MAAGLLVLVGVALLDGGEELGELSLVLGADLGESEDSGGLFQLISLMLLEGREIYIRG